MFRVNIEVSVAFLSSGFWVLSLVLGLGFRV